MAETPEEAAKRKDAEAAAAREQGVKEKSGEAPGQEGEVDWKDLLRIEREARLKAESDRDNYKEGLLSKKRRERQADLDDPDLEDDNKPITRKDLKEVITPIISETKVDSILNSVVTDPAKRAYVKDIFDNRIQRTGTSDEAIRSDLEAALALADSKRISKENAELKRMNDNNRTYVPPAGGDGGGGGGGVDRTRKAHEWTPEQESALERRAQSLGISGDNIEKYKERAWREVQAGTAFSVKPKPRS